MNPNLQFKNRQRIKLHILIEPLFSYFLLNISNHGLNQETEEKYNSETARQTINNFN